MLKRRHRNPQSMWRFNMTPLIDVTFLLLTYFMLASHYASAEKPDMDVPHPDLSQAIDRKLEDKVIINLLYEGQSAPPQLTYGPVQMASIEELSGRLDELAAHNPNVQVVLRADRRLKYGQVRQVMEVIASHRLSHLQVVAELGEAP